MFEAAVLYYEKNHTQQQIATILGLSRQTVSKLLSDAVKENIVEIKINNPQVNLEEIEKNICNKFGVKNCIVGGVSSDNELLRNSMTVKAAAEYINSIVEQGNQKIALSWGRTILELIKTIPQTKISSNVVFPLFGATDNENLFFSPNELARSFADKTGATAKYAWFPYLTDSKNDSKLLKNLSYYKNMQALWNTADVAILGIGNTDILDIFGKNFGYSDKHFDVTGDIATHFFNENGDFINLYENTLCASVEDIKNARQTIAIACGDDKVSAISGALKTGLIHTLITDEHTARKILDK